jgi:hypothetical protein
MTDILNKSIVLVLNRNWQAINVRTLQEAFCIMATNVATGLEIEREDHIRPVTWEEWITLPIRPQDNAVHTVRGAIRVPTVIVAVNYAKVPKKRPNRQMLVRRCERSDGRGGTGSNPAFDSGLDFIGFWLLHRTLSQRFMVKHNFSAIIRKQIADREGCALAWVCVMAGSHLNG